MLMLLSALSPDGPLAYQASSWPYILVFAVMVVAGLAAAAALKKS